MKTPIITTLADIEAGIEHSTISRARFDGYALALYSRLSDEITAELTVTKSNYCRGTHEVFIEVLRTMLDLTDDTSIQSEVSCYTHEIKGGLWHTTIK